MEKKLIIAARTLSLVFNPFYLPLVGLILLFWFTYLSLLPLAYKLTVLLSVYLFTILFPTLVIRFYRNYHGWKLFQLGQRERRMVPYIVTLVSYFSCYYLMNLFRVPHFISTILVIAIIMQMLCAFINVWWKISTHSAAVGGMTGLLIVFSEIFGFYLMWWLYLALIISGCVGSSRIILRQHNLSQVLVGYGLGFITSILIIIYI